MQIHCPSTGLAQRVVMINCPGRGVEFIMKRQSVTKGAISSTAFQWQTPMSGLGGLVVSALDFQAVYRGFESHSGRDNFQTIITTCSYSTCPGLSIKWTGRRLVTDSGTKCAWVIHESKAVQIHVHNNRHCLYVPRVSGSVKNPHNRHLEVKILFLF